MNSYQIYCDDYYKKTGLKFHWFLGSCCLEVSKFNETALFNSFASSTNIEDADIVIVGKKLSERDIKFLNEITGLEDKRLIAFGICSFSGGIFESQGMLKTLKEISKFKKAISFVPGCPPTLQNFIATLESENSGSSI